MKLAQWLKWMSILYIENYHRIQKINSLNISQIKGCFPSPKKHGEVMDMNSHSLNECVTSRPWEVLSYLTWHGFGEIESQRLLKGFFGGLVVKNPPALQEPQETQVRSLDQEDSPEEGMPTNSRILAWRIPWTEEPERLWSMESQRVRHDWSDSAGRQAEAVENMISCNPYSCNSDDTVRLCLQCCLLKSMDIWVLGGQ